MHMLKFSHTALSEQKKSKFKNIRLQKTPKQAEAELKKKEALDEEIQ